MVSKHMKGSELIIAGDGTLYHIALKRADKIPKNIFLVGDPARVKQVARYFDGILLKRENREFITICGKYKGIPMAVMSVGIGTDNTEIAAVELHALNEYDCKQDKWADKPEPLNVIRIGTCGSPQRNIPVGSLAISSYAIGLDNTGAYYPYTSGDSTAQNLFVHKLKCALAQTDISKIHPYVSRATPKVTAALIGSCGDISLQYLKSGGFYVGITSSASGFYAPQGRRVGRLNDILIPDLQEILEKIDIDGVKVINNEMESSAMFRILGERLNYNVGSICAVLANRNKGEFVPPEEYKNSVDRAIRAGLGAMKMLAEDKN